MGGLLFIHMIPTPTPNPDALQFSIGDSRYRFPSGEEVSTYGTRLWFRHDLAPKSEHQQLALNKNRVATCYNWRETITM